MRPYESCYGNPTRQAQSSELEVRFGKYAPENPFCFITESTHLTVISKIQMFLFPVSMNVRSPHQNDWKFNLKNSESYRTFNLWIKCAVWNGMKRRKCGIKFLLAKTQNQRQRVKSDFKERKPRQCSKCEVCSETHILWARRRNFLNTIFINCLRWFPGKRTLHRFSMKLCVLSL